MRRSSLPILLILATLLSLPGCATTAASSPFPASSPFRLAISQIADGKCGQAEQTLGIVAAEGIYAAMGGPAYETPAEVTFLRQAGASVVGMSVVPEAIPAVALGLRVLGLSSVTNAFGEHVEHEDVVRVSNETAIAVGRLLVDILPRMRGA